MDIIIKSFEGKVLYQGSRANLSEADLSRANLSEANLFGAGVKVYQSGEWTAYITPGHIRIGCQYYSTHLWTNFSDTEIAAMHPGALSYWRQNKEIILSISRTLENV